MAKKKTFLQLHTLLRIFLKIILILAVCLSAILIIFRYVPVPTSAFIFHQNSLAKQHPKIYAKAKYHWVDLKDMSPSLPMAVMASEDQRFLDHYGFDFIQIKAALQSYQKGNKLRGASTITQQLAKNLFLWSGRSPVRKGLEAIIVPFIELWWPKRRILEVYLNVVQFGPVTYGVHQASLQNFTKLPKHISDSEAAWLVAVLPSPSKSNIQKPSPQLRKRHNLILEQMKILKAFGILKQSSF